MSNFLSEISKVYNKRINAGIDSALARIFESSSFEKDFHPYKLNDVIIELASLKNQNILDLTLDGSFILTDFGISQL